MDGEEYNFKIDGEGDNFKIDGEDFNFFIFLTNINFLKNLWPKFWVKDCPPLLNFSTFIKYIQLIEK